jgi:hypothetical protein
MTSREMAVSYKRTDSVRQFQQTQSIAHRRPAASDRVGQFVYAVAVALLQFTQRFRDLDFVKVTADDVLHKGEFEELLVVHLAHDDADSYCTDVLGSAQATLTGDKLEASVR